jgi:hypothetical protein
MNGIIKTVCPECGAKQRVEVNFPSENAGFKSTTINCCKCNIELVVTDQHEYDANGLVKGSRVVDEHSTDMCAACDVDLATCDTIFVADSRMYCSRDCGIHDFKVTYGDKAEQCFDDVAEEINPKDIGIIQEA